MRSYRNMKSRVLGIQKLKAHLYKGLEILSKETFYSWAKDNAQFLSLHSFWVETGYDKESSPSIDRVDSTKGYTLDNMRWVTKYENSENALVSRYSKR